MMNSRSVVDQCRFRMRGTNNSISETLTFCVKFK